MSIGEHENMSFTNKPIDHLNPHRLVLRRDVSVEPLPSHIPFYKPNQIEKMTRMFKD